MKLYAGLDVALETTSVCVVDEEGRIRLEAQCLSEPAALIPMLEKAGGEFVRIGLEAGPLSQWLYFGLVEVGLPAVCIDGLTRNALFAAANVILSRSHQWTALKAWGVRLAKPRARTLNITLSHPNRCDLRSNRDPVERDLGFRLLEAWHILEPLEPLSAGDERALFPALLDLHDMQVDVVVARQLRRRGLDVDALAARDTGRAHQERAACRDAVRAGQAPPVHHRSRQDHDRRAPGRGLPEGQPGGADEGPARRPEADEPEPGVPRMEGDRRRLHRPEGPARELAARRLTPSC